MADANFAERPHPGPAGDPAATAHAQFVELFDFLVEWGTRVGGGEAERLALGQEFTRRWVAPTLAAGLGGNQPGRAGVTPALEAAGEALPVWFINRIDELRGLPGVYDFLAPPDCPNEIGRIGGYRILRVIGTGGMGVVFDAAPARAQTSQDVAPPKRVAIKAIIPEKYSLDLDVRFVQEARLLIALDGPNVVRVLDAARTGGEKKVPYIVMEYVTGLTLQDLIEHHAEHPVPLVIARDLIRQMACGLETVHADPNVVAHRDLKPANVLLKRGPVTLVTPSGWHVLICDVGLALPASGSRHTPSGIFAGTPGYRAPEQLADEPVDARCDVFALGVIAYQLLTGLHPFGFDERFPPVPPVPKTIPQDVDEYVRRMLERDPNSRPRVSEVAKFFANDPSSSRRGATSRTTRVLISCGVAISFLLLIGLWWRSEYKQRQQKEVEQAIDIVLHQNEWPEESLVELGDRLARLATYDSDASNRKWTDLGETIRSRIGKNQRLEERDAVRLQAAIKLLQSHDAERAASLNGALKDRRSSFQRQWQWPDTDPNAIFSPGVVAREPKALVMQQVAGGSRVPRVVTRTKCGAGGSRLRVEFDESWLDAPELGLELNAEDKTQGYVFSLHPVRVINAPEAGAILPGTFRAAQEMRVEIELRILRRQEVLARSRYAAAKFPGGPLALTAERNGAILTLTVDGIGTLKFEDVFAAVGRSIEVGRFAIHWPVGTRLLNIQAEEIVQPKPSPLERGDDLYTQESYPAALTAYDQAGREDLNGTWRAELQYKKALCKVRLKHDEGEIVKLFQAILDTGDEQWRPHAYVQLWSLYLRQGQKDIMDADALVARKDQYFPRLNLTALVRRVPEADWLNILEYYRTRVPSSHATGLGVEDRIRLALSWVDADEFLFGDSTESRFWLSRAYSRAKMHELALSTLNSLTQKDDNLNVLTERIWLFRRLEKPAKALEILNELASLKRLGTTNADKIILSVLRAECHADQGHWDLVEADLAPDVLTADLGAGPDRMQLRTWLRRDWLPRAWLMRGFARTSRDSKSDVQDDWDRASRNVDEPAEKGGFLVYVIARSLAGVSDGKDVDAFVKRVGEERSGSNLFAAAAQALKALSFFSSRGQGPKPEDIMKDVVREMWRTEEGRKWARAYAFRTWDLDEQLSKSKALAVCEFLRQHAFLRSEDPDQWLACWAVAEKGLGYASGSDARIVMFSFVSAWLGKTDRTGIDALFDKIPAEHRSLRAPAAYVLAHRMLSLNRPNGPQEAEYYLGRARTFTGSPDPSGPHLTDTLKTLIATDLRLLKQERGILVLRSDRPGKAYLTELKDGKPIGEPEGLTPSVPKEIKAGHYRLDWESPGGMKSEPSEIRLGVCRRLTVHITGRK